MIGLHGYSIATAVAALFVLVAGALVNANHAALSVPDWPLSYGQLLLDTWRGNTRYEQSHRVAAAIAGFLIAGLVLMVRRRESFAWVRRTTHTAAALYFVQVLLGGVVVLTHDPPWLAVLHITFAHAVFTSLALVAMATFGLWQLEQRTDRTPAEARLTVGQRRAIGTISLLAWLQVLLGAASRHPPAGEIPYVVTLLTHWFNAVVLLVLVITLGVSMARTSVPRSTLTLGRVLLALVVIQWMVAIPLLIIAPEPNADWPPPDGFPVLHAAHVALAALIVAFASILYATRFGIHEPQRLSPDIESSRFEARLLGSPGPQPGLADSKE